MSKARVLADFISDGSEFADGTISVSEVSGAAPLASPTFTGSVTVPNITSTGNISLGDDDEIRLGDADDFQLFHDGFHTRLYNNTGDLHIRNLSDDKKVLIQTDDGSGGHTNYFIADGTTGETQLHHLGSEKLSTSSTGVDITGEVKADKFTNDEALPDIRPSLLLDFANSKTLDPRITFTRGSTATYWDGHTTTKAEENLITYSQDVSQSTWGATNGTLTNNAATAPDGTTTAAQFTVDSTSSSTHYAQADFVMPASSEFTTSFYVKANGYDYIYSRLGVVGDKGAVFNLSTGAVHSTTSGTTATITDVGNSWYRCTYTATSNSSTQADLYIFPSDNTSAAPQGNPIMNGDGTSGYYLWGAQCEIRSSATAYTPTTSSPIVKYQPVLQTAASGEARFDHDPVTGESKGLLIEEARTNRMLMSERITSSSWSRAGTIRTGDVAIAPDGTQSADWLQHENSSVNYIYQSVSVTQGDPYTISCYVKKPPYRGSNSFYFNWDNTNVTVDLSTSTPSFANIDGSEHVGNGWYRFWKTITASSSTINTYTYPNIGRNPYYGGLVWGFQLERGNFPTSYIKTESSTVTRSVDTAKMTSSAFADFYSINEISVYGEFERGWTNSLINNFYPMVMAVTDGTSGVDNALSVYVSRGFEFTFESRAAGSGTAVLAPPTVSASEPHKFAGCLKTDDFAMSFDGSSVYTDNSGLSPVNVDELWIGSRNGSFGYTGTIKKLAFYPQRLSNATLQAMTEE